MNRDEAHAAIVLILSDAPADYRFTDQADDILDALKPLLRECWDEAYGWGRDDEAQCLGLHEGHCACTAKNPYA